MRNVAVAALRQIGFGGREVAAALGLTENYVATLYQRARREGTAGLVRPRRRPRTVADQDWEQARAWRAAAVQDAEIARRLGVQQSTVLRRLGLAQVQGEFEAAEPGPAPGREDTAAQEPPGQSMMGRGLSSRNPPCSGRSRGSCRRGPAGRRDRRGQAGLLPVCGAMLLHAYPGQAGADPAAGRSRRRREAALLSMVSTCFALGAATAGQFKHLARPGPGRWSGWTCCRRCGHFGPGWPRSRIAPTR